MAKRFEEAEGVTLAMAQATISNAMRDAGVLPSEMARRLGVNRSRIPQLLSSDGMTMRTFAAALAACGYEVRFSLAKVKRREGGGR